MSASNITSILYKLFAGPLLVSLYMVLLVIIGFPIVLYIKGLEFDWKAYAITVLTTLVIFFLIFFVIQCLYHLCKYLSSGRISSENE